MVVLSMRCAVTVESTCGPDEDVYGQLVQATVHNDKGHGTGDKGQETRDNGKKRLCSGRKV
jgi:hypothetical protein